MKGDIGAIEVDIRPDELENLVLDDATFSAIEQEGEDRFRLARSGLLTAPASNRLPVELRPKLSQREDMQSARRRRGVGERFTQGGPL